MGAELVGDSLSIGTNQLGTICGGPNVPGPYAIGTSAAYQISNIFTKLLHFFSYKKDAVVYRYSEWSKYSACTKSCGNGVRIRTRECFGDVCTGPATETKPCKNLGACPSKWLFCNFMFINFMCQAEKI